MSTYTRLGFKAYYDNTAGPFASSGAGAISGSTFQQLCEDLGDSCLFQDQSVNTDVNYFENDDFVFSGGVSEGWTSASSGAGAGIGADAYGRDATERAVGSINVQSGTTATGYAIVYKGVSSMTAGNGQFLRLRQRVALETLGSAGERYTAYVGFGDNIGAGDMTDGCYFRYNDNVNSGKWECVTAAAGVRTATDSTVAAVGTFCIFEVRINAAGTSVEYYINDVLVATNTTNIPTGANYFGLVFKIEKSVGTTSRSLHMDWYDFLISLTSAR